MISEVTVEGMTPLNPSHSLNLIPGHEAYPDFNWEP